MHLCAAGESSFPPVLDRFITFVFDKMVVTPGKSPVNVTDAEMGVHKSKVLSRCSIFKRKMTWVVFARARV